MADAIRYIRVTVKIEGQVYNDDGTTQQIEVAKEYNFSDGTGSNQVGQAWRDDSRTLATTSEDLDLAGSLTGLKDTIALNNVKLFYIENLDTDTGDHIFLKQGSGTPVNTILGGTTPTLKIGPGGFALLVNPIDGYAVTAGANDKIAVETVDNSSYKIILAGDDA